MLLLRICTADTLTYAFTKIMFIVAKACRERKMMMTKGLRSDLAQMNKYS